MDGDKRLACQLTRELGRAPESVSDPGVVPHTLSFDDTGDRVVYAIGPELHGAKQFFLHEFRTGRTSALGTSSAPEIAFVGGNRLLEIGALPPDKGLGATLYDLEHRTRSRVFVGAETGGIWRSAEEPSRILIGKERDDTRDLYSLELPR